MVELLSDRLGPEEDALDLGRAEQLGRRARGVCAPSSRLSRTVRNGKSRRRSSTWATPAPTIACGGRPSIRSPRNVTCPLRGGRRPEIVFMSVDLPAPLGPSKQTISP